MLKSLVLLPLLLVLVELVGELCSLVICRESSWRSSVHRARELVEKKNSSKATISVVWPSSILPRKIVLEVFLKLFCNLFVDLCLLLRRLFVHSKPEDHHLIRGFVASISARWIPKVDYGIDSFTLFRRDW